MPLSADKALGRALLAIFADDDVIANIGTIRSRPWASATFSGARHRVALRLSGPKAAAAADTVLADLGEREFMLPGHILIDIACEAETRAENEVLLILEALTVEAD